MKSRTLAATLTLLCAAGQAWAQATPTQTPAQTPTPAQTSTPAQTPTPQTPAAKPSPTPEAQKSDATKKYEALLEKAKKGEGEIDFKALRFAFFETPEFNPLSGMLDFRAVWGPVFQSNWAEAVKQAEIVLAKNYVDANAHMTAHIAYRQQGNEEKAKFHRRWADGLLASITAGGDGKSPETAWHVISTSEQYAVLQSMNLRRTSQALINANGHAYDMVTVVDPQTKAEVKFFFNVDKPLSAYGRK